jgi:hypothetical protein
MSNHIGYPQRLREAFDFRNNPLEATARTLLPTVLASLALSAVANEGVDQPIPAVYHKDATPDHIRTIAVPGDQHYEPAHLSTYTVEGPGVSLNFPQAFARDFKAKPFNSAQRSHLNNVAGRFNKVFKDDPNAKVAIRINGRSSDESETESRHGDMNLGKHSPKNHHLALGRAKLADTYLETRLRHKDRIRVAVTGQEVVLDRSEIGDIDTAARDRKLSRSQLIHAFDRNSRNVDSNTLHDRLSVHRGATISSTVTSKKSPAAGPCDEVVRLVHDPGSETTQVVPGSGGWGIYLLPLLIPPLPRRRRKATDSEAQPEPTPPAADPQESSPMRQSTGGSGIGHSSRFSRVHDARITELPRLPRPQIPTLLRRSLGIAAIAALLPFPWITTDRRHNQTLHGKCETTEIRPGSSGHIYGNLASIAVYRLLAHKPHWNKQWDTGDTQFTGGTETTTTKSHMRYTVNEQGRILQQQYIAPTQTKRILLR